MPLSYRARVILAEENIVPAFDVLRYLQPEVHLMVPHLTRSRLWFGAEMVKNIVWREPVWHRNGHGSP